MFRFAVYVLQSPTPPRPSPAHNPISTKTRHTRLTHYLMIGMTKLFSFSGDALLEVGELDRSERSIPSLVASLSACPVNRQFKRIGVQHPKGNRNRGFERNALKSRRNRSRDVLEVRRFAPDHASQTDHRVEFIRTRHLPGKLGN